MKEYVQHINKKKYGSELVGKKENEVNNVSAGIIIPCKW